MSKEKETHPEEERPADKSMAAFSENFQALEEALGLLYIRGNASARLKFKEKWPGIADYLFGEALIAYDHDGVTDKDHRAQLEDAADERRVDLKSTMTEIVDKSVLMGTLQVEYVGGIIDRYGPAVSPFLYKTEVIERVRPGLTASQGEQKQAALAKSPPTEAHKSHSADVAPIETPRPPTTQSSPQVFASKPTDNHNTTPKKSEMPRGVYKTLFNTLAPLRAAS